MTRDLAFPPCPGCGCPSPSWSGSGVSPSASWDGWECPRCGQEWREHFPADHSGEPDLLPCPVAEQCEGCGQQAPDLAAREADTPAGPVCLTLCPACVDTERVPRWSHVGAAHRVLAHCAHTGPPHPSTRSISASSSPRPGDSNSRPRTCGAIPGRALDGSAHPDTGAGPCARCGRIFDERDDRPYCPLCEDGPHEPTGGERP